MDGAARGAVATVTSSLTPLQLAALGVLIERPMHPYEAYSLLAARRTDMVVKPKPGTLYHAIADLVSTPAYSVSQLQTEATWLDDLISRIIEDRLPWHGVPKDHETLQAVSAVACEHASALYPLPPRLARPDRNRS